MRVSRLEALSFIASDTDVITVGTDPGLTQSRRLVGESGEITLTDGGAGGDLSIGLADTAVTPGTYGDSTHVAQVTVDAHGRLTAASAVAISGSGGGSITEGAYGSLPGSPSSGDVYLVTDAPALLHYSGGVWNAFGPLWALVPVDTSGFSWVNQGSAAETALGPYTTLTAVATAGTNLRLRAMSAPGTPYTVTAALVFNCLNDAANDMGLFFRESGTGAIETFGVHTDGAASNLDVLDWTNATTFSATVLQTASPTRQVTWLRIADDGANRVFSYSFDGYSFVTFTTVARTTFLTADQVGFFVRAIAGQSVSMSVLSWVVS